MKSIKRVRLLNPSIYHSKDTYGRDGKHIGSGFYSGFYSGINDYSRYPVVVEVQACSVLTSRVEVGADELDRAFPFKPQHNLKLSHSFSLSWVNNPFDDEAERVSWEDVSPFDFWNELKRAGRKVGDKPRKGYL